MSVLLVMKKYHFILFILFLIFIFSSETQAQFDIKIKNPHFLDQLYIKIKKEVKFGEGKIVKMTLASNQDKDKKGSEVEEIKSHSEPVLSKATLAGGCFWCVEADLEKLYGVKEVISGYTGGSKPNPSYKEVSSGYTGHVEAVQVIFDPKKISYSQLLDAFWRKINPLDEGGQFVDRGFQYTSAIFYHDDRQKKTAEDSKKELQAKGPFKEKIVTPIKAFTAFYKAEDYHQDYYKKSKLKYNYYRYLSGRDQFLKKAWKNFKDFRSNPPLKTDKVSKVRSKPQRREDSLNKERKKSTLKKDTNPDPSVDLSKPVPKKQPQSSGYFKPPEGVIKNNSHLFNTMSLRKMAQNLLFVISIGIIRQKVFMWISFLESPFLAL